MGCGKVSRGIAVQQLKEVTEKNGMQNHLASRHLCLLPGSGPARVRWKSAKTEEYPGPRGIQYECMRVPGH